MEPATGKMKRTPSSLLLRISDICKVHSVGVAPASRGRPKTDGSAVTVESSEEGAHLKVHPHQVSDQEGLSAGSSARCGEAVVEKLLDAISDLKLAYVKVQQAHVPYDSEELIVADERFASELEETAGLKDLFVNASKWNNPMYRCFVDSRIQQHQKLAMELQAAICKRDSEIVFLQAELDDLLRKNMELDEKIVQNSIHRERCFIFGREEAMDMFMELFELSSNSIHDFAKLVIGWMKVSGWNQDILTCPMDRSVVYKKRAHKKYAVEAYFACGMLIGDRGDYFSVNCFDHTMSFRDPFDALMEAPDSNFGRFCQAKYLVAVSQSMEYLFFGNLDHRAFVKSGGHPRTPFYQAFVRMSRCVWALLTVAHASNPKAEMFYVKSGAQFQKKHMEIIPAKITTEEEKISIGFTVMPGFKIGCTVIRCKVYPCMGNTGVF